MKPGDFVKINLTSGPGHRPIGNVADSLSHFKTIAFGIETMREWIRREYIRVGSTIEAGNWLHALVPECYRAAAIEAAGRVLSTHYGRKIDDDLVRAFVDDLNREIFASVEPIEPGYQATIDGTIKDR